jgi:hypothetical protein
MEHPLWPLGPLSSHPTTEPFATCVAAITRNIHTPEEALETALRELAASYNHTQAYALHTPETILAHEAFRHGYEDALRFKRDLIPAIHKRAVELCGHGIFH